MSAGNIEVKRVIEHVMIEMNIEAASILQKVLWGVGGEPSGPRGRVDELLRELKNVGISPAEITLFGSLYINK